LPLGTLPLGALPLLTDLKANALPDTDFLDTDLPVGDALVVDLLADALVRCDGVTFDAGAEPLGGDGVTRDTVSGPG
jgi:hypothetical protein